MLANLHPKKVLEAVTTTVRHPIASVKRHPLKTAAVAAGAYLLVDYLVRGHHSVASSTLAKVLPHRAAGTFGPGWGRGNMPVMYGSAGPALGGHWQQTPADVSHGHMGWQAASGHPQTYYSQSSYPWG
jgi:hypothetical protein